MQLYSLTIFRALAIALVVFSHAESAGALVFDTVQEATIWNLLSGATTIFVFISGFLFHHVFLKRFEYRTFLTKKLQNLVIPYVILTFAAILVGCQYAPAMPFDGWLKQVMMIGYLLLTGHAAVSYWYIPFVISLFAMAPLHMRFIKLGARHQALIIALLLGIALLIHRPIANLGPIHNLLYYTPVYLIGIFCSQHRDAVYPALAKCEIPLFLAVIGLAWLEAVSGVSGNYFKPMLQAGGVDLMLLQKLCLCLFMLSFLRRFENMRSKSIDALADTSFAIFFLHPLFITLFRDNPFVQPYLQAESWGQYVIFSTLCLLLCAGLALWAQRVFGVRSRLLTGY